MTTDCRNGSLVKKGQRRPLKNFLKNKVTRYNEDRNDPIIEGTSRISPYLALGILSSKRCILEALKLNNLDIYSGNKGILKWIDEIVWREFYRNIMHFLQGLVKEGSFQQYTDKINWRYDESEFQAWKMVELGFQLLMLQCDR